MRRGGIAADHQPGPEPRGEARPECADGGIGLGLGLEVVGGEEERTRKALETVSLGIMVAGGTLDREIRPARLHQPGEGLKQAAGGGLPVEVGRGDVHGRRGVGVGSGGLVEDFRGHDRVKGAVLRVGPEVPHGEGAGVGIAVDGGTGDVGREAD